MGKLELNDAEEHVVAQNGFIALSLNIRHGDLLRDLPLHHPDPFDRVLIVQALEGGLTIPHLGSGVRRIACRWCRREAHRGRCRGGASVSRPLSAKPPGLALASFRRQWSGRRRCRPQILSSPVTEVAMSRFPRGLRLLCAIAFTLQACGGGGSTEPPPKPAPKPAALSNPDSTAAQLQSLNAPFRTDVFVNFGALHQHFGPAGATPVAAFSPMAVAAVTSPAVAPGLMRTEAAIR